MCLSQAKERGAGLGPTLDWRANVEMCRGEDCWLRNSSNGGRLAGDEEGIEADEQVEQTAAQAMVIRAATVQR